MILLILLTILTIAGWVFFGVGLKTDKEEFMIVCSFVALSSTVASVWGISTLFLKNDDARSLQVQRDYYQDIMNNLSDNVSLETVIRTFNGAKNINTTIEKNRKHCNNPFYGSFYNKKIAEIELINIPALYLKDFRKGYGMDGAFW